MTAPPQTDWDLVAAARAGDHDAFARLYRCRRDRVAAIIGSRVKDPAAVEDLTAEVFTRAWANLHRVTDRGSNYEAWLATVARTVALDYVTSARMRHTTGLDPADVLAATPAPDPGDRDTVERLRSYVEKLPGKQRTCIELRIYADYNHTATAAAMGCGEGASRATQVRAVASLRRMLEADGYTASAAFVADIPSPR